MKERKNHEELKDEILPPLSRRGGVREKKKQEVLEKIRRLAEIFVGV